MITSTISAGRSQVAKHFLEYCPKVEPETECQMSQDAPQDVRMVAQRNHRETLLYCASDYVGTSKARQSILR
jgi:hypothetical protein